MSWEAQKRIKQAKESGELDLSWLNMITVPTEIAQLTQLTSLDLKGNKLTTLPAEIGQLTQLTSLDLRVNKLASLPAEIGQLTQLTSLFLNENQLASLPAEFGQLTQLTSLDLRENQLASLPDEIGQLAQLTSLFLSGNQLASLPAEFAQLTQLTMLYFSGNQLTTLPAEITQLTQLTSLVLWGNQLALLPAEIQQLTKLTSLYLSGNQLSSLPAEIGQLTQLTTLDLSGNKLGQLPAEIGQLTQLTSLDLRRNQLTSLPAEIAQLTRLTKLFRGENLLNFPPKAILAKGTKAILSFLLECHQAQRQEWRSKIILVGEGGTGKTSLLKQLLDDCFDPQEPTTHGLQIRDLPMKHPDHEETMHLKAWDFGGQHILHATHQFFLTGRSLYVLVWNARLGHEQGKLNYWLDMIQARDPKAPVLIVAAHAESWQPDIPYQELCKKYPMIEGRYTISNRDRAQTSQAFTALQEQIRSVSATLPLMGATWPKSWLDTAEWVRGQGEPHTSPSKLKKAMKERGVQDQETLEGYLHDLGDILYFREIEKLNDLVILDASWVARHISVALASPLIETGLALFTKTMMKQIWKDVDEQVQDLFLRLMEEFDLSYKTEDDEEKSIVVEKLSSDEPDYKSAWAKKEGELEIAMVYRLESSLPPGIPTWFIARSHRFTTHTHWRYGALLSETSARTQLALIRANNHARYVELRVRGPHPHNFFALLKDGLELTLNRYPGLQIKREIPCPGHDGKPCENMFDYDELLKRLGRKDTIECFKSWKDVSVRRLLFGISEGTLVDVARQAVAEEVGPLRELVLREFLKITQIEQEKMAVDCPRLFLAWPQEQSFLKRINELGGKTINVQLICEAPGCWHLPDKCKPYQVKYQANWQKPYQPMFEKLVGALKLAAPLLPAGTSQAVPSIKDSLKFMEALGSPAGNWSDSKEQDSSYFLREVLAGKDEKGYGLRKLLTKEGHIYWVCEDHYRQFETEGHFTPL